MDKDNMNKVLILVFFLFLAGNVFAGLDIEQTTKVYKANSDTGFAEDTPIVSCTLNESGNYLDDNCDSEEINFATQDYNVQTSIVFTADRDAFDLDYDYLFASSKPNAVNSCNGYYYGQLRNSSTKCELYFYNRTTTTRGNPVSEPWEVYNGASYELSCGIVSDPRMHVCGNTREIQTRLFVQGSDFIKSDLGLNLKETSTLFEYNSTGLSYDNKTKTLTLGQFTNNSTDGEFYVTVGLQSAWPCRALDDKPIQTTSTCDTPVDIPVNTGPHEVSCKFTNKPKDIVSLPGYTQILDRARNEYVNSKGESISNIYGLDLGSAFGTEPRHVNASPGEPEMCIIESKFTSPVQGLTGDSEIEFYLYEQEAAPVSSTITLDLRATSDNDSRGRQIFCENIDKDNLTRGETTTFAGALNYTKYSGSISGIEGVNVPTDDFLVLAVYNDRLDCESISSGDTWADDPNRGKLLDRYKTDLKRFRSLQPEDNPEWGLDAVYALNGDKMNLGLRNFATIPKEFDLILEEGNPENIGIIRGEKCDSVSSKPLAPFDSDETGTPNIIENISLNPVNPSASFMPSLWSCIGFYEQGLYTFAIAQSAGGGLVNAPFERLSIFVEGHDVFGIKISGNPVVMEESEFDFVIENNDITDRTANIRIKLVDSLTNKVVSWQEFDETAPVEAGKAIIITKQFSLEEGNYKLVATVDSVELESNLTNNSDEYVFTVKKDSSVSVPETNIVLVVLIAFVVIGLIRKK